MCLLFFGVFFLGRYRIGWGEVYSFVEKVEVGVGFDVEVLMWRMAGLGSGEGDFVFVELFRI